MYLFWKKKVFKEPYELNVFFFSATLSACIHPDLVRRMVHH